MWINLGMIYINDFFHYRKLKNFKNSTYCVVFIFFQMFIILKCVITFSSFQKTNKQTKKTQVFLLDNYLMGYLFCFDWGCCQHAIY